MARYYFDTRDNDVLEVDLIGVELPSLDAVKKAASAAMADLAKDALPGSIVRTLAIEVRSERGPVLRVSLRFEVEQVAALP